MLLEYVIYLKKINFFEFFFQIILIYNFIQILKQNNFFFTLAYFLNFIVFIGLSMLFYDLDLGAIILWIIYGGVVIIFFLYSIMWVEILKLNIFFLDNRLVYYLSFYIYIYILIFDVLIDTHIMFSYEIIYNMTFYFDILNFDIYEELELLGDSFFFF